MVKPVVDIRMNGPGGSVIYREGRHEQSFGWDLGTGEIVATIYVPSAPEWDATLPWAAGRRSEVLTTLAREVCRRKCRGCLIEISERWIHLREPPALPKRIATALRNFFGSFREGG